MRRLRSGRLRRPRRRRRHHRSRRRARRGRARLRTALVERHDFASGTSSKSSKLVHGGLRYLQQREFRLVYEALYERQRALENAPHLVRVLPFLVPVLKHGGVIDRRLARCSAPRSVDVRPHRRAPHRQTAPPHVDRRRDRAHAHAGARPPRRRVRALRRPGRRRPPHADHRPHRRGARRRSRKPRRAPPAASRTGDRCRRRAGRCRRRGDRGAGALRRERGRRVGRRRARARRGDHPASIRPAKGVHITVPWARRCATTSPRSCPCRTIGRSVFVVPWGDFTYVGTTDTDYDGRSTTRPAPPTTSTTCSAR